MRPATGWIESAFTQGRRTGRRARLRRGAIDQGLLFPHRQAPLTIGRVLDLDENQFATATAFGGDRQHPRTATDRFANPQGQMESDHARSPHPPRQIGQGRQKAVGAIIAQRMPVRA